MTALAPSTSGSSFSETSTKSANRLFFPQQKQQRQRQRRRQFIDSIMRLLLGVLATAVAPIPVDSFVVSPQQVLELGGVASRGNRHRSVSASGSDPLMVRSPLLFSTMQPSAHLLRSSCVSASKINQENSCDDGDGDSGETDNDADGDGETIETLQNQLVYIEALEERNKAQLDSFIDEEDQWESMEDYEKELMSSKEDLEKQLNELLRLSSEGQG